MVTLQVLAENFSSLGVPVFMADIKGDLTGISQPGGQNPKSAVQRGPVVPAKSSTSSQAHQAPGQPYRGRFLHCFHSSLRQKFRRDAGKRNYQPLIVVGQEPYYCAISCGFLQNWPNYRRRNKRSRFQQRPSSISCCQGCKGRGFGGKEVVKEFYPGEPKRLVLRRPIAGSHLHALVRSALRTGVRTPRPNLLWRDP